MKGKNLLILTIAAIIMVAMAVKTTKRNAKVPPDVIGKNVFPNLALDNVEKITVRSAEGTAVIARTDDRWTVPERYNYPADFNKVKDCMLKMSDMKIGQVMKISDKQKDAMKLVVPTGVSSNKIEAGVLVELHGKANSTAAALLIGEARTKKAGGDMPDFGGYPDGQYVSPDGGKNVYLINATFTDLPLDTVKWLDQDVLNVMSSDITEISITGPDRKAAKIVRKKEGTGLEVEGVATNEVTVESKMYSLESALTYFKLDDVADPALKAEAAGLDKPVVFKVVTQKGEIYSAKIGKVKEGTALRYCKLEVTLEAAGKQPEPKTDDEKKKLEQAGKDRKDLEDKTRALNDKLSKWTYLVAQSRIDTMTPLRESLIEKKKDEKKKEEPAASSGDINAVTPPATPGEPSSK